MKRKRPLILVAFLMFLYIAPLVFISSYGLSAIPAQQNMIKDFAPASEIELADYGEDQDENYDPNYVKTHVLDNDAFEEIGTDIEIWFYIDGEDVGYFNYANYLYASSQDDCNIGIWNFDESSFDNFGEPLPTSYEWMNGTVYDTKYWNATHIGIQLSEIGVGDANFYWDYACVVLYAVPEWFDESWLYRKNVTITGASGASTNYQVNLTVPYNTHMQTDFDDLRFTAYDGFTEWDYWIESYVASTSAVVWVEVRDDLGSNVVFWMYYGNDAVSTTSDGENTFLFYEDWSSQTTSAWTQWKDDAGGSIDYSPTDAEHGYVARHRGADGDFGEGYKTINVSDVPYSLMFRVKLEDPVSLFQGNRIGTGSLDLLAYAYMKSWSTYNRFDSRDDDSIGDTDPMDVGHWGAYHTWEITRPRDGSDTILYIDGVLDEQLNMATDENVIPWACFGVNDIEKSLWSDWFASRKFIVSEPEFDAFGEEDPLYPPEWNVVGIAGFIFIVSWDPAFQFGYDAFFIFLGLIMLPVSTMYLVKGGRKEMSTDKIFYGLIVFTLGLAFFIGGIMP